MVDEKNLYAMNEKVILRPVEEEMKDSYIDYAMSVIVGRALPDVRDGLKPVHRRILFAMNELGLIHSKAYKKSARIVGEVLGKYHPHGDTAVYDSMVRMAQDFSLRYTLVSGQGNFGCFTKDTKLQLTDGRQVSFEDLIREEEAGKKNYTYSVDANGKIKIALIQKPRLTRKNANLIKIKLDNGEEIKCTLDHKLMLITSEYRQAQDLKTGDLLKTFQKNYQSASAEVNSDKNHKVVSTQILTTCEDVYDITIAQTHNFALAAGVFVHNSVDGDSPAAMRYTEARLTKVAEEILSDIDKETVAFTANFDETLQEPVVLPSKVPNLLINGSVGIAVGMATNVPPHNLIEIGSAVIALIDKPELNSIDLMEYVKGPDFPTAGIIYGKLGLYSAYKTGHGRIVVRAKTHTETVGSRNAIIIDEIPYQVNKSAMIEETAQLVRDKVIEGIHDIRDESDRDGMRIVIELKKDAEVELMLNQLFKHTRLQVTVSIMNLCLVNNIPRVLSLQEMLQYFIDHRFQVITKRTQYELKKAQERAHILRGLKIAIENLDAAIALIKKSPDAAQARLALIAAFPQSPLDDVQAQAILDMKLQRLTGLEREKIIDEHTGLLASILQFEAILASREKILSIIKEETQDIIDRFGDERKTEIVDADMDDIGIEDLVEDRDDVVTITHEGYIKRVSLDTYRSQKRGGRGIIGTTTKDTDFVERVFVANTKSYILFFTNQGQVHWLKVYQVPEGARQAKGKAVVNLLSLQDGERVTAAIPVTQFDPEKYLILCTKKGVVKKSSLVEYSNPRNGGIRAIRLLDGDELIKAQLTDGKSQVILATAKGIAIRFDEADAREVGRVSQGVRGIKLDDGDYVIGMVIADDTKTLLTITANGYGKRTAVSEYRLIGRGGKGVINIQTTDRNGDVVAILPVDDETGVLFMSKNGITLRTRADGISVIGRNTQGVRLMRLEETDAVVSATIVPVENDIEIPNGTNTNGSSGNGNGANENNPAVNATSDAATISATNIPTDAPSDFADKSDDETDKTDKQPDTE